MRLNASTAAGILLLLPTASGAVEEIKPPFKLTWGETTDRLERLLQGAKTKIVERRIIEGREAWEVEGIVQPGLRRTLFYFRQGELVEVELQYQKEEWDQAKYDQYMGDMRRSIEAKYGQGQLIARKTEAIGDVNQTVVGYKWNQNNTALELIFYSAEDAKNSAQTFRTLSVHYRSL
jgi:hypothetical protein